CSAHAPSRQPQQDASPAELDQRPIAILAGAQCLFGTHARCDVDRDAADQRTTGLLFNGELERRPPMDRAVLTGAEFGHLDWLVTRERLRIAGAETGGGFGRPE